MPQKSGNNYGSLWWTGDFLKLERKSQEKVCSVKDSGGLQWDCLFYWNLDRFGFGGILHS